MWHIHVLIIDFQPCVKHHMLNDSYMVYNILLVLPYVLHTHYVCNITSIIIIHIAYVHKHSEKCATIEFCQDVYV